MGSFDQEEDDEDPHGSWTRNPKAKNRAQKTKADEWLPELDEDTFQFDPQFDDEEDEAPAPAAKGKRVANGRPRPAVRQEEDDLDLPWAEGMTNPMLPLPLRR